MTYDSFSNDYDRFVSWPGRLELEMPFIESQLQGQSGRNNLPLRVLDAACGTGMHAIALAKRGYQSAGADLSHGMIERARANALAAGIDARFEQAGFGELRRRFAAAGPGREAIIIPFDGILCLGNSLPHLLTEGELESALADFAACLRPSGLLLVQNRNFDLVMSRGERWMEPQSDREGEREWLFLRFYDFEASGLLGFNILTLRREGSGSWQMETTATHLRPLRQADLAAPLARAGFENVKYYGNMSGDPFDPASSGNLVITAVKA